MTSTPSSSKPNIGAFVARLLHRDATLGPILISPAFIFLAVMMAYPFVYAVYLSFTDKEVGGPANFTGLENYQKLFGTTLFAKTVTNSLVYTFFALLLKFLGGLALAMLLNRPFIGQNIARALMLLPWILPTAFSTLIWQWVLSPSASVVNEVLVSKLGLISQPLPFLRNETWAMASIIAVNVWRGLPFFGITFLAAIQSVSSEILEASRIDGASSWQSFWRITFPMILPVVTIVLLISTIGTLGDFDLPFLLTRGGPNNATTMFALTTYTLSLGSGLIGLGSAVTLTMFPFLILLIIVTLIRVRKQQV